MKYALTAIIGLLSLAVCACGQQPGGASPLEKPIPTAADLAARGTLDDWTRAPSEAKSAYLENAAASSADKILKATPSTSADDALSAAVIYFRQCLDAFVFAGVDAPTTTLSSMMNQCETAFNAADSQTYLARVYQARRTLDAAPAVAPKPLPAPSAPSAPPPLPTQDEGATADKLVEPEHYPPPDFGE